MGSVNLREGLVGEWNMEGGPEDTSGNGYDLTPQGTAALTTDRFNRLNRAYVLDGDSDYFTLGDITSEFTGSQASIIMWVKLDVATPASSTQTGIMKLSDSGASTSHYPYTDGNIYLATFRNVRVGPITPSANVDRTEWHMVSITTKTGGSGWNLYQNLELVDTQTGEATAQVETSNNIAGDNGDSKYLDGKVGIVKLWNRTLSAEELKQVYNEIKPHYQPLFEGCVSHYDMGGDAKDLIGGYDGTVTGMTLTTDRFGTPNSAYDSGSAAGTKIVNTNIISDISSDTLGTVNIWVNTDDSSPTLNSFIHEFTDTVGGGRFEIVQDATNLKVFTLLHNGSSSRWTLTSDNNVLTVGSWDMITVTQDGVEPVLYINGAAPAQTFNVSTDKTAWVGDVASVDTYIIGERAHSGTNGNGFDGQIGETSYWNRALSADEVKSLYDLMSKKKITPFSQGGKE